MSDCYMQEWYIKEYLGDKLHQLEGLSREQVIDRLIELGSKRWTKDDKDRLYLSLEAKQAVVDLYEFEWLPANKTEARRILSKDGECIETKLWDRWISNLSVDMFVDLKTDKVYSKTWNYEVDRVRKKLERLLYGV